MLCEAVNWSGGWTPAGKRSVGTEINPTFYRRDTLYLIGHLNLIAIIIFQQHEKEVSSK